MIIPNGKIQFLSQTDGGIDENGYPYGGVLSSGPSIDCQYNFNENRLAKSGGESIISKSFTIWVEMPCEGMTERIRLEGYDGRVIGDFSVKSITPLQAVCQYQITV